MRGAAAVLLLLACGDARSPWLGEWTVSVTDTLVACGGGTPYETRYERSWVFVEDAAGLAVPGVCRSTLSVEGSTCRLTLRADERVASFDTLACRFVDGIGDRGELTFTGGELMRTEGSFSGILRQRVAYDDGRCFDVTLSLAGQRP